MKFVPEEGHRQEGFDFVGYLDGFYGYAMVLARDVTEADLMQENMPSCSSGDSKASCRRNVKSRLFTYLVQSMAQPAATTAHNSRHG